MKTNISSLMNLISEEERNFTNKNYNVRKYAINTSVEELNGRITIIKDNKELFEND